MELLSLEELKAWLALDDDADQDTLALLQASGIAFVEHETGRKLLPYTNEDGDTITPEVPFALKHAVAVFIHAHFDTRAGDTETGLKTVRALCHTCRNLGL